MAEQGTGGQKGSPIAWHAAPLPEVLSQVEATEGGLTTPEAARRLAMFGPNQLPHKPPPAFWVFFARQLLSPLIYILLAAAFISVALNHPEDAAFIFAVLLINAAIGGYQEWRADLSTRALQSLLRVRATVLRDGEATEVDAEGLVPGDIVFLESGNRVPADLRLLTAAGLAADESMLTGESLASNKDPAWQGPAEASLGDRHNMAFAGAPVARGRGKGVVVATGGATVVGQLALDVASATGGVPPLLHRMERFTRAVALAVLVACTLVGLAGITLQGKTASEMFLFAVALAVSAIPEGLPVALTVALAAASSRMARRNVIVRRLAAVEGLGSCTLIASDKTGTLTCNELTVREVVLSSGKALTVTGEGFAPEGAVTTEIGHRVGKGEEPELDALARAVLFCNEAGLHRRDGAWVWRGDAADVALLALAGKLGLHREDALAESPELARIPFEPEWRYAASFHRVGSEARVYVKGAPERVMAMCGQASPEDLARWRAEASRLGAKGLRVLAVAEGPAHLPESLPEGPPEPSGLTFLGLTAMIDPPRPGVREALRACQEAGIGVCMITGDHPVTALAIARDLGLAESESQVMTGEELTRKAAAGEKGLLQQTRVFARVSPRQKLEIVEAARQSGHFVAVTGDGVNDAPALRAANIGVAMGRSGTDVAREAADLVVTDDNFATIVSGVEEGRVAYSNVRKVIYLLISTGAAELFLALLALVFGLPLPLLAVQLLWLNLVTNGIQDVALAFEPAEGDELKHPPRPPNEPVFNLLMIERTVVAAVVIGGVSFAAYAWMLHAGWELDTARNGLLLLLVLFENVHIGNCRSEVRSAFDLSPLRSPILLAGTVLAQLIHLAMMYLPIGQRLLRTEPVSLTIWLVLLALALSVLAVLELHKWLWRRRWARPAAGGPGA
jgi:magnesium-transporting ATPase (P-type)